MPRPVRLLAIVVFALLASGPMPRWIRDRRSGRRSPGSGACGHRRQRRKVVDVVAERKDRPTVFVFIMAKDWIGRCRDS